MRRERRGVKGRRARRDKRGSEEERTEESIQVKAG